MRYFAPHEYTLSAFKSVSPLKRWRQESRQGEGPQMARVQRKPDVGSTIDFLLGLRALERRMPQGAAKTTEPPLPLVALLCNASPECFWYDKCEYQQEARRNEHDQGGNYNGPGSAAPS